MDTRRYAAFIAAAETKSMSGAAKRLGYTPSGIVRLVNALESELGFALLYRTSSGVSLTPQGEELLPTLRELMRLEERVEQASARICGLAEGGLLLGVQAGAMPAWLPEFLDVFLGRYPDIRLATVEERRSRLIRMLQDRELDCALFYGSDAAVIWTPLHSRELVAWVPSASDLAENSSLLLAELEGQDMIGVRAVDDTMPSGLLEKRGVETDARYKVTDARAAHAMVAAGLGCALHFGDADEACGDGVAALPLSPQRFVELGLAAPAASALAPAAEEFASCIGSFVRARFPGFGDAGTGVMKEG